MRGTETEHALGVGGSYGGDALGGRVFQFGDLGAYIGKVSGFVALAPVGCRGEVGAVGFEHEVAGLHAAHGVGETAVFEGDDPADAEKKIAAGPEPFVSRGVLAERVEDAPQPAAAELLDDGEHLGPRAACMHGDGQAELQGPFALAAERFGLLAAEIGRPIKIEPDFAEGAESGDSLRRIFQILPDPVQLLAPTGIVVDRRGMQTHHGKTTVGVAAAKGEQLPMAGGIDGREHEPPDPRFDGPGEDRVAVGVELGLVEVAMGVGQKHGRRIHDHKIRKKSGSRAAGSQFHVPIAGQLPQGACELEPEQQGGQLAGFEPGELAQGLDRKRVGGGETGEQAGLVGSEGLRLGLRTENRGLGLQIPTQLDDDVLGREDGLRLTAANQKVGAGGRTVGDAARNGHDRTVVLVGKPGRDERPAAVGRLDDDAPGAEGGDDAVAGDVGGAVLPCLAAQLGDEGAAVVEHVAGDGRMVGGDDVRQGTRQDADGGDFGPKGRPMRGGVDAESEPGDDREPGNPLGEPLDEPAAHDLPVRSDCAGADDGETTLGEPLRIPLHVDDMRVIGNLAQEWRVLGVGRCDGDDAVLAAIFQLLFGGGESGAPNDLPGEVGPQLGPEGQLFFCRRENPLCRPEALQQMHGAFHPDSGRELQGDVFDGHGGY